MLLLSLLVETGQHPGVGLTQADKTCTIKILFGDSQGEAHGFQGGQKPPCPPLDGTLITNANSPICIAAKTTGECGR